MTPNKWLIERQEVFRSGTERQEDQTFAGSIATQLPHKIRQHAMLYLVKSLRDISMDSQMNFCIRNLSHWSIIHDYYLATNGHPIRTLTHYFYCSISFRRTMLTMWFLFFSSFKSSMTWCPRWIPHASIVGFRPLCSVITWWCGVERINVDGYI